MSYRDGCSSALRTRPGRPLRVGLVGAGQMGTGFAAQLLRMPGIALSAVLDVDRERAVDALGQAGITPARRHRRRRGQPAIENGGSVALAGTDDLGGLPLDIVVEATGVPDVGARSRSRRWRRQGHRHPERRVRRHDRPLPRPRSPTSPARIYSVCRGDEPVETKILVDFARDLNFEVVCAGKGKNNPLDPHATPATSPSARPSKGMNPKMLSSFVDGSKAMIEMAALANTTGWGSASAACTARRRPCRRSHQTFALNEDGGVLDRPGVVDYCTGPVAPGRVRGRPHRGPLRPPRDDLPADGRRARTSRSTAPTTSPASRRR